MIWLSILSMISAFEFRSSADAQGFEQIMIPTSFFFDRIWNYRLWRVPVHDGKEDERHGQRGGTAERIQGIWQGQRWMHFSVWTEKHHGAIRGGRGIDIRANQNFFSNISLICECLIRQIYTPFDMVTDISAWISSGFFIEREQYQNKDGDK